MAECADRAAAMFGSEGLSGILDDGNPAAAGNLEDGSKVGRLPVEVHRNNGLGALGDERFNVRGIDVERVGAAVGEDRSRAGTDDGSGSREEGERGADDLVARADSQGQKGNEEGVGAGGDADG